MLGLSRCSLLSIPLLTAVACGGQDGTAATQAGSSTSGPGGASSATSGTLGAGGAGGGSGTGASGSTGAMAGSGGTGGNPQPGGTSLRFFGNGVSDIDRVKIRVDLPPPDTTPGPPADIGAEDFTLEFWMRGVASENTAGPVSCGDNLAWINGNIVFDRDRYNQDRKLGLSLAGGMFVFGVSGDGTGDTTLCGTAHVLDDAWHHVAVLRRRSDGRMWLFIDGNPDGPGGDISYPDDGVPGDHCGGPCTNSDPFLVIGAEKHDAGSGYPSYSGFIDEVRLSRSLRYAAAFPRPASPFATDGETVGLYHFDEGQGDLIQDSSGAPGGPSDGARSFGGSPAGPEWSAETPF